MSGPMEKPVVLPLEHVEVPSIGAPGGDLVLWQHRPSLWTGRVLACSSVGPSTRNLAPSSTMAAARRSSHLFSPHQAIEVLGGRGCTVASGGDTTDYQVLDTAALEGLDEEGHDVRCVVGANRRRHGRRYEARCRR